jgi:hypothetical protein
MREGRGKTLGRHWAEVIGQTIELLPYSRKKKRDYLDILILGLEEYSFEPRRVGEPVNSGCVMELEDDSCTNIMDPSDYAKFIRENLHVKYQKETSRRIMESMLEELEYLFDDLL